MRKTMTVLVGSFLLASCSSTPEFLRVDGEFPGETWRVVAFEGPVRLEGDIQYRSKDAGFDVNGAESEEHITAVVSVVEMERGGWGAFMPWGWFRQSRAFEYVVRFTSNEPAVKPDSWGGRRICFWRKPIGVLTEIQLTVQQLLNENGDGDDDWTFPIYDWSQVEDAREYLRDRALAKSRIVRERDTVEETASGVDEQGVMVSQGLTERTASAH